MRRLLILLGLVAVVGGISYAVYSLQGTPAASVTSLLPAGTAAFAHLPDFRRTRDEWLGSDLYALYREPAVQEFFKPSMQTAGRGAGSHRWEQLEQLDPKDVFVAVTSVAQDQVSVVGGFRFRGRRDTAQQIIDEWRTEWFGGAAPVETSEYQQHQIDVYRGPAFSLACVYDGSWFFASNNVTELKLVLDRADHRPVPNDSTLLANKEFRAATAHLPSSYALQFYAEPKRFAGAMESLSQMTIERVCATTRFDHGKIHDVIFVGTPRPQETKLSRETATLGSKDTFLYLASGFGLSQPFRSVSAATIGGFLGGWLQKIREALTRANVSTEMWEAAFGSELGVLADWPADAHWPWGVAVFPVKDHARAMNLASLLARSIDEDAAWSESEHDGVHYFSMEQNGTFILMRPTIAVTPKHMIVGVDPGSIDAAIKRSGAPSPELTQSAAYRDAAGEVATPETFFAYVDLALLYRRLDATLRPMLLLGAAFMPGISARVDLNHVPPAEIVAKHLSPIVSSQQHKADGYVLESVGPITLNQSGIALLALATATSRGMGLPGGLGLPPAGLPGSGHGPGWRGKGLKMPRGGTSPEPVPGGSP